MNERIIDTFSFDLDNFLLHTSVRYSSRSDFEEGDYDDFMSSVHKTPRNLMLLILSITSVSIFKTGTLEMSSSLLNLWKRVNSLLAFSTGLLELNHFLI